MGVSFVEAIHMIKEFRGFGAMIFFLVFLQTVKSRFPS